MNKLSLRWIRYASYTCIMLLFIWGIGPFLATQWSRLTLTILLMLVWSMLGVTAFIRHKKRIRNIPIIQHTLQSLALIKKHFSHGVFHHNTPTYFLVVGRSSAGKTTLLAHTELELHPVHSQPAQVNWWLGEKVVFIDPSGELCFSDTPQSWQLFLTFLKRKLKHAFLGGVILVIDSSTLSKTDELEQFRTQLIQKIHIIAALNRTIPITLVITQCDLISGFQECFADLSPEERQQSLGLTLSGHSNTAHSASFENHFEALLCRLNDRLLWLLHHEKNLTRRSRIKDFPLQLEYLSQSLKTIIALFPVKGSLQLQDVYFTSSLQKGNPTNILMPAITKNFHLIESPYARQAMSQKPYFIQRCFKNLVADKNRWRIPCDQYRKRFISYPIAFLIIFSGVMTWHHAYLQSALAINDAQSLLTQPATHPAWLFQLNTLQKILHNLKKHTVEHYRWIGLGQGAALYHQTHTTYQQLIRTNFVLYLDQLLTKQMQQNTDRASSALYNTLQIYLMFVKPAYLDPIMVKQWFSQFWQQNYPKDPAIQRELMEHLNHLLELKHISWPVNYTMIYRAQEILKKRPLAEIAFSELCTQYKTLNAPVLQHPNIAAINIASMTVPAMYSMQNFNRIYNTQIPQLATAIAKGNWVLGDTHSEWLNSNESAKNIQKQLQTLYLKNYIQQWNTTLNQIQWTTPKNFEQLLNEITLLTNDQSPLWQMLKQSNPDPTIPVLKNDQYTTMQAGLQHLQAYITKITQSPDPTKAAYDATVARFKDKGAHDPITDLLQISQHMPSPMGPWLKILAQQSWKILLDQSRNYLNTIWIASVLPEYHNKIMDRFPIVKNTTSSIAVTSFNRFFGPDGTLESFFNYYLNPFVNTDKAYWVWKSLDDEHLDVPQETLNMFIRASMIQQMFYTENSNSPKIIFSLTPLRLSPDTKNFTLNIGGQIMHYPSVQKTRILTWPGPLKNTVTLEVITRDAHTLRVTHTGIWAWFALLENAHIQMINPKTYHIVFILHGKATASYQLKTHLAVNPYLPNVLTAFRCPENL